MRFKILNYKRIYIDIDLEVNIRNNFPRIFGNFYTQLRSGSSVPSKWVFIRRGFKCWNGISEQFNYNPIDLFKDLK